MTLYLFCLYITPVITVSASFGSFSFDLLCELIDWSLCDLDALIEVHSFYLIYVLFVLFIYLFALCYICFCLLILLILLFVVVDVVVAYSFFNSFDYSCCSLLFMLPLCIIRTLLSICIHFCSYLVC